MKRNHYSRERLLRAIEPLREPAEEARRTLSELDARLSLGIGQSDLPRPGFSRLTSHLKCD